ncbi:hypothetical protein GF324_04430 [bacterium]|nr:hypothetical protein [bacterium]
MEQGMQVSPGSPGMENPPQEVVMHGYRMNPAEYITRSLVVLRDNFGPFLGFALLAVLAQILLEPALLIGPALLEVFFAGAVLLTLKALHKKPFAFGEFFDGFQYFLEIFLYSIVSTILVLIGFMLFILPGIYLVISYTLAVPFILDRNMGFWQAMESSRKTIGKSFFGFLGLYIILFFLAILVLLPGLTVIGGGITAVTFEGGQFWGLLSMLPTGLLLLAIPLLFMLPFSLVLKAVIYDDIARQCDPNFSGAEQEPSEPPLGSGSV